MKKPRLRFKTVVLSDIHLGAPGCRIDEVNHFMKHTRCEKLILNGDIIDTWQLKGSGTWTVKHSRFIRLVLNKIDKHGTRIIYLRGNHDDLLDRFLPMSFANIHLVREYVHRTAKGDYLVLHGDVFDAITTHMKWLAKMGDFGYNLLLKMNRYYNAYRAWRGKGYDSLSQKVKAKVKGAVSFISKFEEALVQIAKEKGYAGVICGHIHTAADKELGGIHYLNSGDWVESLTALVEHADGRWEIISYPDFLVRLSERKEQMEAKRQAKLMAQEAAASWSIST